MVIEYIYKGFKISYNVTTTAHSKTTFKADGALTYLLNMPENFPPQKFHTEDNSYNGAEHEIRKLLENYIDFELKNFYDMKKETAS